MVDKCDLDIGVLRYNLGNYLEINDYNEECFEQMDLTIMFMNADDILYQKNYFIIDDHVMCFDNNVLYVYLDNQINDEMLFVKRLLTDLSNRFFEMKGGIFLHASSIVDGQNTIMFIGDKGSGKTTNMLYILDSERVAYSSNERTGVMLDADSGQLITYGNPARINIRAASLRQCESLREKLDDCIDQQQYLRYREMNLANNCSERLVVDFNDISSKLQRDIVPCALLDSICNLIYSPSIDFMVEEIDYMMFRSSLANSIIDGVFPKRDKLNEIFPTNKFNLDDLLLNSKTKFYNIYQDFKTNNSREIMKILRKGYSRETKR